MPELMSGPYGRIVGPWMEHFRARRLGGFKERFPDIGSFTVVDVGGTLQVWDILKRQGACPGRLVIANLPRDLQFVGDTPAVGADGQRLPFRDKSVDLVFCNSVIEHVGGPDAERALVSELTRVGRRVYVQTPNKWFPVEPHTGSIGLHWLPRSWFLALARFSVRGWAYRRHPGRIRRVAEELHLLSRHEVAALFPDGHIEAERFAGLAKSFIVYQDGTDLS